MKTTKMLPILVLVLALAGTNVAFGTVIERRVADMYDDAEEHVLDGSMEKMYSSDLELGYENNFAPENLQTVGIRLRDIQIPQGATITSAWVQFSADSVSSARHIPDVSVIIEGELSPNSVAFTSNAGNITDRPVTTASVVWDIPRWMEKNLKGPDERTPDISPIIQEIVNQPDWAPGNAIVLMFRDNPDKPSQGTREAESFDGDAAEAPLLHITVGIAVASQPDPADGATDVPRDVVLSWTLGIGSATHDVYFGTTSPPAFLGSTTESSYDLGPLELDTTYYWQINCIEADGTTKHTGDIWSFKTEFAYATQPNPANGAERVPIDTTLSWWPGGAAATHDVYFGTSSPPPFIGNQAEPSYDPGPLELSTTYYWQIDAVEADGTTIHTGDIWSFTTAATAGVKKGAYLIYPGDNTQMTVLWQLDATHDCTLEWGTDPNYGNSATSSEYGSDHQHQYTITSLAPGAKYYYRVQVEAGYLTGSFVAAPAADAENVKFLAYGDTRTYPHIHDAVNAQMIATYTADPAYQTFTMLTGDWVASGDNESYWTNQFFNRSWSNTMEMQANLPINGCVGNHEQSGTVFEKYWPYPYESGGQYWSFDYGPAHIVVVELKWHGDSLSATQKAWLEADLAASTKEWKFLQFHAPVYSAGGHPNNTVEQAYIRILCQVYGVAAVFCGHNHNYARAMVNGVAHITTGGGGAPLAQPEAGHPNIVAYDRSNHFCKIDIQGKQLTFEAVRLDGTVIDTFTMSH